MNMKKLLALFAVCALFLTACQPDPVLTLSKEALEFDPEGGTQSIRVSSNYAWNALLESDVVKVSPTGAAESADVAITLPANTSGKVQSYQVVFVCANKDMSSTKVLNIAQNCQPGRFEVTEIEYNPQLVDRKFSAEGGTAVISFNSNVSWTLRCRQSDVTLDLESGSAGLFVVTATIPPCPVFEGRAIEFEYHAASATGAASGMFSFSQAGGIITYGGEVYHAAEMKDGNWWMIENLRYVPAGMTPSDNKNAVSNGIWYPLVIDELTEDKATVKFSTAAADIKANGYLYSSEVALGLKPGDITVDNAGNYEGVQGICPSGWHIPTKADIVGLVGKTADKNDTNPNAPYFDPDLSGGNGSVAKLNADGFNAGAWGAVSIANTAATTGTTMGAIKAYQKGMNTGYIAGSTLRQVTTNDDGSLKNVQYVALMPNMNTGTFNGAWNNYRNGVSVRCVKNK
jgi:uncharacterized protein (TIGR02145 family)